MATSTFEVTLRIRVSGGKVKKAKAETLDFLGHADFEDELSIQLHQELIDRGLDVDTCEVAFTGRKR